MRLVVTENITLDGVVATIREHMAQQDALLLGRATFESLRGYWPAQTDDTTGITDHLDRVTKYVVSTTFRSGVVLLTYRRP